jgi:hypothetical protein
VRKAPFDTEGLVFPPPRAGYPESVHTILLILVPAAFFVVAVLGALALQRRWETSGRPWPGSWPAWLGIVIVLAVVGLFVAPRLLGITFLFLPLIWIGGLGRRHRSG